MEFKFLSKHFPPPRFLRPVCFGVSFSESSIKAIYFDKDTAEPDLKSVIVPIESGSIVSGSIANMDEIVKKLSVVKEKFNLPFVFFTIPDELTYVFSSSVLVGPKGDAAESVAFIIEENVPLSLEDTIFDFVPTKVVPSDLEYKTSVVVAACVKKEVEKFVDAFHRAGLEPLGCIHESQAIANALVQKDSRQTLSVVHARENRIGIYLVKDGLVHFSTLRSVQDGDYKKNFLDEYEKFLEYCLKYNTDKNNPIRSMLVCGEFDYAKKLVEAVIDSDKNIENIKLSNVWINIFEIDKHIPDIPYEKSLSFAGSIGAVLSNIN